MTRQRLYTSPPSFITDFPNDFLLCDQLWPIESDKMRIVRSALSDLETKVTPASGFVAATDIVGELQILLFAFCLAMLPLLDSKYQAIRSTISVGWSY